MTDWFRSWHGAPSDPKWRAVARLSGVSQPEVIALVWALLDRASSAAERGSVAGYDLDILADTIGSTAEKVAAVIEALTRKGVLVGERFAAWEKRQPRREDYSAERVRAFRSRAVERAATPANAKKRPETEEESESESSPREGEIGAGKGEVLGVPAYGAAELDAMQLRFDLLDVRGMLPALAAWCDRQGIAKTTERKSAIFGALRKEQAERQGARRILADKTGPPLAVSQTLAASVKSKTRPRGKS